ncbi:hypothetical protein GCM10010145_02250 [Streptomyces ruber]|uniref:Uncharacterized protein n=2 Tax=Streptomyces TaxID=1883 RepID=A0A918B7D3_9ACTN|nr:hypothetical protein [Streptomyces ruber]GGQ38474.1 hypothetical protein GCM10010145_02250 [Streptomyces ruber]
MKDAGRGAADDPTLVLGVHGILDQHPWVDRVRTEDDLDEDVFSLVTKRASAYGFSSTLLGKAAAHLELWEHNDADGDWAQDGRVRQLAWLQATLPGRPRGRRLPLLPAVTVLTDALHRVGTVRFTGLHAVVPLRGVADVRAELATVADWYALADPDGSAVLTVTVSARPSAGLAGRDAEVREAALARTYERMTVEAASLPGPPPGLASPLAGEMQTTGMRQALAFRCGVREWSPDVAAWTTEIFADALRATGTAEPVLVTVSQQGQ